MEEGQGKWKLQQNWGVYRGYLDPGCPSFLVGSVLHIFKVYPKQVGHPGSR